MASNPRITKAASSTVGIEFDDLNDWGTGFVGGVTLTNTSGRAFTGWTLEFDLAQNITNLWNGVIVSHTGTHYVIRNASWNGNVAAGGTVSFGFQATGGNPVLPSAFTFNGTAIGGSTPPPVTPPTRRPPSPSPPRPSRKPLPQPLHLPSSSPSPPHPPRPSPSPGPRPTAPPSPGATTTPPAVPSPSPPAPPPQPSPSPPTRAHWPPKPSP